MVSIRITGTIAMLCLALSPGCGLLPGSAKSPIGGEGPHRVPVEAAASPGDDGGGAPEAVTHHWVGLNPVWKVEQIDEAPHHHGLVSDGVRVVALRKEIEDGATGELTGYDGATGKRLWQRELAWSGSSAPVAEDGTMVVPIGAEVANGTDRPAQFVALDTVTGERRWRVKVRQRAFMTSHLNLPAPAQGAILDGVFYYADGPRLYGRDLVTGKVRFHRTSKTHLAVAGPVAAGDRLVVLVRPDPFTYVEGLDGNIRSVAVLSRELTPVHQLDLPKRTQPTQVTAGGEIAVVSEDGGSNPHMWGIDTRTGKRLWSRPLGKSQYVGPPVGGVLPILDSSRNHEQQFAGHDLRTGRHLWKLGPRRAELRLDAAAGGRIVIYNHDGLMGFD